LLAIQPIGQTARIGSGRGKRAHKLAQDGKRQDISAMTPTHQHNQSGLNHIGKDKLTDAIQMPDPARTQLFENHATTRSCRK
jgi:hypothetical protein